jgi:outer membrane immunogenic protein
MKRIVRIGLAGAAAIAIPLAAQAADLAKPVYKGAPPPAYFSWTGCYLGTHSGLALGHTRWTDTVPDGAIDGAFRGQTAHTDMVGAVYGGQIGCDYQFNGNWVIGVEGSLSGSTLYGATMDEFNNTWGLRSTVNWFGGITGRVGVAVDRVLLYTRGGVAFANNKFEIRNTSILDGTPSTTRTGWVIGSGIELSFAPSWSVFVEADYYNFGNKNVSFPGDNINPTAPFTVRTPLTIETLKFGVNYRFGGGDSGPVMARY